MKAGADFVWSKGGHEPPLRAMIGEAKIAMIMNAKVPGVVRLTSDMRKRLWREHGLPAPALMPGQVESIGQTRIVVDEAVTEPIVEADTTRRWRAARPGETPQVTLTGISETLFLVAENVVSGDGCAGH